MNEIKSFFVTVLSSCSTNLYTENTLSKFRNKLPHSLSLEQNENWLVGVTRFSCNSIKNLILNSPHSNNSLIEPIIFKKPDAKFERQITIIEILQILPKCFNIIQNSDFFKKYETTSFENIENYESDDYVEFSSEKFNFRMPTSIVLTPRAVFDIYFSQVSLHDRASEIQFLKDNIVFWKKLSKKFTLEHFDYCYSWLSKPNNSNYLCIYSDIIKPRIIGDQVSRVMYIHPIQSNNNINEWNVINIKNVEYYPLEKSNISEIDILLADETGEQIDFNNSSFSTMISLHFKKL